MRQRTPRRSYRTHSPMAGPLRVVAKTGPEEGRRHNRALVLQKLFSDGPASRADLARATGLTRVTISDLVSDLIADGFATELGIRERQRTGKPARLVGLSTDRWHVLALDLSREHKLVGARMTLDGQVRTQRELDVRDFSGEDLALRATELASKLAADSEVPVLGVGVATPGIVDDQGRVLEAPNLGWADLPLGERLRDACDAPVFVDNDANTLALGLHTFYGMGAGGLLAIAVQSGVGVGLVVGGVLLAGDQKAAGEIGHITVDPEGRLCACGRRGCLETVVGSQSLRRALAEESGDAPLRRAGVALGGVLAPIVSALNVGDVVVSGPGDLIGPPFVNAVAATVRERTLEAVSRDLSVVPAPDEDVALRGAETLVLGARLAIS